MNDTVTEDTTQTPNRQVFAPTLTDVVEHLERLDTIIELLDSLTAGSRDGEDPDPPVRERSWLVRTNLDYSYDTLDRDWA